MTKNEIKTEFEPILNRLIEFSNQRRHWYQDQVIRISDQQAQHISIVSSIAAAILVIIIGFQKIRTLWIEITFWLMVSNVILGFILVLSTILFNRKVIDEERAQELPIIDNLKTAARLVVSSLTNENRSEYIKLAGNKAAEIENESEKYKRTRLIFNVLYYLFIGTFLGGILALVGMWQNWDLQSIFAGKPCH